MSDQRLIFKRDLVTFDFPRILWDSTNVQSEYNCLIILLATPTASSPGNSPLMGFLTRLVVIICYDAKMPLGCMFEYAKG